MNKKNCGLIVSSLLISIILFSGCQRVKITEGTHEPVRINATRTQVRYNNVALLDDSLNGTIAIQNSGWNRTPTGTAQVWVQIRNRTDYRYNLECRVQFFAKGKVPIGQPSAWERISLTPNEITTYREKSMNTDIKYYYIEIREMR
ncbi:MAG: hypothetical protein U9O87_00635 [Verrucomicrobiota bacterium]|nr:hypothetical protein [Verrucomicrobiota bacterium]